MKRTVTDEHTGAWDPEPDTTSILIHMGACDRGLDTTNHRNNSVPFLAHHLGAFTRSNASEFL